MSQRPSAPVDVLALGELDGGNLGNDGTFRVFLDELRREAPATTVRVFGYGTHRLADALGVEETTMNAARSRTGGILGAVAKVTARLRDFPRTAGHVRRSRIVVIPGTGLFEGDHGTSFVGWPLAFWRTAMSCRLHRRPLLVLGVGASDVREGMSRRLLRSGLRAAQVVTCRDQHSVDVLRGWLGSAAPVLLTADMVFARDDEAPAGGGFVAVGVMAGGGGTAGTDETRHADEIAAIVGGLLGRGRRVRLIIGDEVDRPVLERVAARFADDDRVAVETPGDLEGVVRLLAHADAVIATRFHNVIAALLSARPTVAISYADKTRDLMDRVGLGEYVMDAADVDGDGILGLFDRAIAAGAAPSAAVVGQLRAAARGDIARVVEALA